MVNSIILFSYLTLIGNNFNYEQFCEILEYDVLIFILLLLFFKVLNFLYNERYNFIFPFNLSIPLFELYESKENDSYYNLHIIEVILACNKINLKSFLNFNVTLFFSHITYEQYIDEFAENFMHFKLLHFISHINYNEIKFLGRVHNLKEFVIFFHIFKKNLKSNFEFDLSICTFLKNSTKSLFKFAKKFFQSEKPKLDINKFYELIKNLAQGNESDEEFLTLFYSKFTHFQFIKVIQMFNLIPIDKNFEKTQGISQYFINQQYYKIENIVLNDKSLKFYHITINYKGLNIKAIKYLISFLKEKNKANSSDLYYLRITYFNRLDVTIFLNNQDLYYDVVNLTLLLILYLEDENIFSSVEEEVNGDLEFQNELLNYILSGIVLIKNIINLNDKEKLRTFLNLLKDIYCEKSTIILNEQIKILCRSSDSPYSYLFKKISFFCVMKYDTAKLNEGNLLLKRIEFYFQPLIDNYNEIKTIFKSFRLMKQTLKNIINGVNYKEIISNIIKSIKIKFYFKFFDNISQVSSQNPYLQVLINDIITNFLQLIDNDIIETLINIKSQNFSLIFSIFQVMLSIKIIKNFPQIKLNLENINVESFSVFFLRAFILNLEDIGLNYENINKLEINTNNKLTLYKNKTEFRLENVLESLAFRNPIPKISIIDSNFITNKDLYLKFLSHQEFVSKANIWITDIKTNEDINNIANVIFQLLFEREYNISDCVSITFSNKDNDFSFIESMIKRILYKLTEIKIIFSEISKTVNYPSLCLSFIVDKELIINAETHKKLEELVKINYIQLNFTVKILCNTEENLIRPIKEKLNSKLSIKSHVINNSNYICLFNGKMRVNSQSRKCLIKKFLDKERMNSYLILLAHLSILHINNQKILKHLWTFFKKENKFEIIF